MSRWLGIDYGGKRVGIAAGSSSDGIATPLEIIRAQPRQRMIARIIEVAEDFGAEGLVVGWPLNMDDSEGPQGKTTRAVAGELAETTGLDVRLWDERLSSFAADKAVAGVFTRKQKRARRDAIAAAVILQDFLASGGPDAAPRPDEIED